MSTIENNLRVLIVDDNRDGADALGLVVEELGHHVYVTYGGRQALDVVEAFQADLILVALLMPDLNGSALVSRLRQIPDVVHTTIVAITGQKGTEHKALATQAGFDTVLFKPVAPHDIRTVLANVVVAQARQASKDSPGGVAVSVQSDVRRSRMAPAPRFG